MSINRNLICLDTETTGLDPNDGCEVVEIYCKALNYWDLEVHNSKSFHAFIKPRRPEKAQAGAIRVIGEENWTKAQQEGMDGKTVFSELLKWIDSVNDDKKATTKPMLIAFNMPFDSKFIRYHSINEFNLIKKGDFGYETPWSFEFDALNMAWNLLESDPNTRDLKLNTVLSKFGLQRKSSDIHTAEEDVELMTEFVKRFLKFQRECFKRIKIK